MRSVIISLDTSDRTTSIVELEVDGKTDKRTIDAPLGSGTAVLTGIEALLKKHNLGCVDITQMRVATGPGSYTGLRVGASIANCLGWLLEIGVNEKPLGSLALPRYN